MLYESTVVSFLISVTDKMQCNFFNVLLQNVEEADRPSEGFYIRSGITVVLKNSIIKDGTII